MHAITRTTGVPVAVVGMIAAAALFAAPAGAAPPYTDGATTSTSTTNPVVDGPLGVSGTGMDADERVDIHILSVPVLLATVTADGNGAYTANVMMPAGFTCAHTIRATGQSSGNTSSSAISIGSSDNCAADGTSLPADHSSGDDDSKDLPRTGAIALGGLGVLALGLLGAGGVLVAKRRKVDA